MLRNPESVRLISSRLDYNRCTYTPCISSFAVSPSMDIRARNPGNRLNPTAQEACH